MFVRKSESEDLDFASWICQVMQLEPSTPTKTTTTITTTTSTVNTATVWIELKPHVKWFESEKILAKKPSKICINLIRKKIYQAQTLYLIFNLKSINQL